MKKILMIMVVAALSTINMAYAQQQFTGLVGDTVNLDLGTVRGAIQWEKSSDNSSYSAISGETNSTIQYLVDALPLYFRAIITEADCDPITSPYVEVTSSLNPPMVTTAAISGITQTTANGGGDVTNDGGSPIIARGLCYSTSPNPTVSNNTTNEAGTTGAFTSALSNLGPGVTYYVRAYSVNQALQTTPGYGNEVSFTTTGGYQIGDTGPGGGKVFYLDGQGGGLEIATVDVVSNRVAWGCSGQSVGATGTAVGTGTTNSNTYATNCGAAGTAITEALNWTHGGQSDWYLPSVDEMDSVWTNLVNITSPHLTFPPLETYWTSSEVPTTIAWVFQFSSGTLGQTTTKTTNHKVRAIRSF